MLRTSGVSRLHHRWIRRPTLEAGRSGRTAYGSPSRVPGPVHGALDRLVSAAAHHRQRRVAREADGSTVDSWQRTKTEPRPLVISTGVAARAAQPGRRTRAGGDGGIVRLVVLHGADSSPGRRPVGRYPSFRGGVAERSNASVLNTEGREPRGFESHPLRHRDARRENRMSWPEWASSSSWRRVGASEGAIPRTRLVDPSRRPSRDDRRHVDDRVDRAFVADEVDVTAVVDEA